MSPAVTAHVPQCLWAQRTDTVFFTVAVEEIDNPEIKLEENSLHFAGVAKNGQSYELDVEFFGPIDKEKSKQGIYGQKHWMFILTKKNPGPYWPRLLKASQKNHWLKADWNKWRDEDEEGEEEEGMGGPGGADFGDMFKNMGGMGGMPGMGGMGMPGMGGMGMPGMGMGGMGDDMPDLDDLDAEDSDDEKLPDLEAEKPTATA